MTMLDIVHGSEVSQRSWEDVLADYGYTVVYFYPKDNTPGCTRESKDFQDRLSDFLTANIGVVGISKDGTSSHEKFAGSCGLDFPLVSDTDLVLHEQFSTLGEKKMFGKTYMGTIRSTFVLDQTGAIVKEWRKISVSGHVDEVFAYCSGL